MKKILLILLIMMGCVGCTPSSTQFTLTFITVDKGDCFLLTSTSHHYLIDTGKAKDYEQINTVLSQKNISHIDGIILTHGHKDHAGSFEDILNNYDVDTLYISSTDDQSYDKINAKEIATKANINIVEIKANDCIAVDDVVIKFWIPKLVDTEEENNNSIITTINHGKNNFLMMADAQENEELEFINENKLESIEVLKLGHHGENNASSSLFLSQINPKIAIKTADYTVNPDSFNHELDKRLLKNGVKVYDANGDSLAIDFISNGSSIKTETITKEH